MIEEIIAIIVPWEAEFAKRYPKLGRVSRPVTAEGDKSGFTSMETYARGELGTYSEELLAMYLDYMKVLKEDEVSFPFLLFVPTQTKHRRARALRQSILEGSEPHAGK